MPKKRLTNDGKSWAPGEIRTLKQLAKGGITAREAAQQLGRTPAAVQQKAMREGISFRSKTRAKPAPRKKAAGRKKK